MKTDKLRQNFGPQRQQKLHKMKKSAMALFIGFIAVFSLQVSTQIAAYKFGFHSSLGQSVRNIYPPWSIIHWWLKWHPHFENTFTAAFGTLILTNCFGLMMLVLLTKSQNKDNVSEYLHGSARWANEQDIKNASLLDNDEGVYVGAYEDRKGKVNYLRHNGPEHILTYAPTRSGKGVGLVIPTLLSWKQSAVITDLKGELWAFTAGWRQKYANNKVIRFEPASAEHSVCWNPLDEIGIGTETEVGDVQNLATLVVDPDGKGLETHWQKTSYSLLVGLILHLIYKLKHNGEPATFPNIDNMLVDPYINIADLLIEMTRYPHIDGKAHPVVSASARDMIDRPEEEAGSVLSTLKSYVALYRDPIVAKNVSHSDFSVKDLMNHHSPVSLYIMTEPNDKNRLRPIVRLMLNMIVRVLAGKMEFERVKDNNGQIYVRTKKKYKHRLLCMIDEFPSLGKLDILQESLAFVAGYGLKFYLICQDLNQLKSKEHGYGPDEAITSNCHIQNAYPPNRLETAEHLSKLTGITTVIKEHITTSGKRISTFLPQVSKTTQETSRPLLTTDECLRMPGPKKDKEGLITEAGDMVIYVAGSPAIYGKQPLYFQDSVFLARASIEAPINTDVIRKRLSKSEEIKL